MFACYMMFYYLRLALRLPQAVPHYVLLGHHGPVHGPEHHT